MAFLSNGYVTKLEDLKNISSSDNGILGLQDLVFVTSTGVAASGDKLFFGKTLKNGFYTNFGEINTFEQLQKAINEDKLFCDIGGAKNKLFKSSLKITTKQMLSVAKNEDKSTYITDRYDDTKTSSKISFGVKRLMDVNKKQVDDVKNLFSNAKGQGEYLYLKVAGKKDWQYFPKKAVRYRDNVGALKDVSEKSGGFTAEELKNTQFFLNEEYSYALVEGIMASASFDLDLHKEKVETKNASGVVEEKLVPSIEEFDLNSLTVKQFAVDEFGQAKLNKDGSPVYVTNTLESGYTEQEFKEITDDKGQKQHKVKVTSFEIDKNLNGNYLRLHLKGRQNSVLVSVKKGESQVFINDSTGLKPVEFDANPDLTGNELKKYKTYRPDIRSIIGKELIVKIDGNSFVTSPVTMQEAVSTYTEQKELRKSVSKDDILGKDTYLRLANGNYVKESEFVRPIAYNFTQADAKNYDAYLYYYQDSEGVQQTVVLNKSIIDNAKASVVRYEGLQIDISDVNNLFKIIKSQSTLSESNIIQTSNDVSKKQHSAVTLVNKPNIVSSKALFTDKSNKLNILNGAKAEFTKAYKQGVYDLDEVLVDGKYEKVDTVLKDSETGETSNMHISNARYVNSNVEMVDDLTENNPEYKFMKSNKVVFNPKTNKLEQGPKFSMLKANKWWFVNWGKIWIWPTAVGLMSLGVFAITFGMAALGIVPAVLAGGWLAGPVVNLIRKVANMAGKNFKSKTTNARKEQKIKFKQELKELYNKVLAKCEAIDKEIATIKSLDNLKTVYAKYGINCPYGDEITSITNEQLSQDKAKLSKQLKAPIKIDFLNKYDKLYNNLKKALGQTNYKSFFTMKNGVGVVNESNAWMFSKFKTEFDLKQKELKQVIKSLNKDANNTALQAKRDELKFELDNFANNYSVRGEELGKDDEREKLLKDAEMLKATVLLKGGLVTPDEVLVENVSVLTEEDSKTLKLVNYNIESAEFELTNEGTNYIKLLNKKIGKAGAKDQLNQRIEKLKKSLQSVAKSDASKYSEIIKSTNTTIKDIDRVTEITTEAENAKKVTVAVEEKNDAIEIRKKQKEELEKRLKTDGFNEAETNKLKEVLDYIEKVNSLFTNKGNFLSKTTDKSKDNAKFDINFIKDNFTIVNLVIMKKVNITSDKKIGGTNIDLDEFNRILDKFRNIIQFNSKLTTRMKDSEVAKFLKKCDFGISNGINV